MHDLSNTSKGAIGAHVNPDLDALDVFDELDAAPPSTPAPSPLSDQPLDGVATPSTWPIWDHDARAWSWSARSRDLPPDLTRKGAHLDDAHLGLALASALTTRGPDGAPLPPVADLGELWSCGANLLWRRAEKSDLDAALMSWSGRAVVGYTRATDTTPAQPIPLRVSRGHLSGASALAQSAPSLWGWGAGWFGKRPPCLAVGGEALRVDLGAMCLVRERLTPSHGARWGLADPLPPSDQPLDADAAPMWRELVRGMFADVEGADDGAARVEYLERWCGLALLGVAPSMQLPALILMGAAGTGKSTLARLIASLYPSGAVASVAPHQWGLTDADGYHTALLASAALNMIEELNLSAPITDLDAFKAIVFGAAITARPIRRDPVTFSSRAAHLWCGNGAPRVTGADPAFWDRVHPLVVTGQSWRGVEGERRDLGADLASERGAIVARLIAAAGRALADARAGRPLLTSPPSSRERLASWRGEADAVACWVTERVERDGRPAVGSVTVADAWRDYQAWSLASGYHICGRHKWGRRVEAIGLTRKTTQRGPVWCGCGLADPLI
jgi:hypothetical protein